MSDVYVCVAAGVSFGEKVLEGFYERPEIRVVIFPDCTHELMTTVVELVPINALRLNGMLWDRVVRSARFISFHAPGKNPPLIELDEPPAGAAAPEACLDAVRSVKLHNQAQTGIAVSAERFELLPKLRHGVADVFARGNLKRLAVQVQIKSVFEVRQLVLLLKRLEPIGVCSCPKTFDCTRVGDIRHDVVGMYGRERPKETYS
jgi:hypothetical protein